MNCVTLIELPCKKKNKYSMTVKILKNIYLFINLLFFYFNVLNPAIYTRSYKSRAGVIQFGPGGGGGGGSR